MFLTVRTNAVCLGKLMLAIALLVMILHVNSQGFGQQPGVEQQIKIRRDMPVAEDFPVASGSNFSPIPGQLPPAVPENPNPQQPAVTAPPIPEEIPVHQPEGPGELKIEGANNLISIFARDADLRTLLATIAQENRLNIIPSQEVTGTVSVTLHDKPVLQALDAILRIQGYSWQQLDNIIYVSRPNAKQSQSPFVLGLQLQVFELNYIAALDAEKVVTGLLSPGGRVFAQSAAVASPRQSGERLIVEDLPDRIQRIAEYISNVDVPPRQVLIEAEILQVSLGEDERHGVNLEQLLRVGGGEVTVQSAGMIPAATGVPSFTLGVESTDLSGVIEFLKSKSNVRTLATPKLLVITGQEGKIQVGSKLGYTTLQQNQTSTIQNVEFLELGVILSVKPIVTRDGQVLMKVQPSVSGGRINPDTSLPEEDTTTTDTTVLLPDGRGMIIGGLIKEDDIRKASWVPYLGDIPLIGKLFRKTLKSSSRSEVIIALTPHIVPFQDPIFSREMNQYRNLTGLEPHTGENIVLQPGFANSQPLMSAGPEAQPNFTPPYYTVPIVVPEAAVPQAPVASQPMMEYPQPTMTRQPYYDSGQAFSPLVQPAPSPQP